MQSCSKRGLQDTSLSSFVCCFFRFRLQGLIVIIDLYSTYSTQTLIRGARTSISYSSSNSSSTYASSFSSSSSFFFFHFLLYLFFHFFVYLFYTSSIGYQFLRLLLLLPLHILLHYLRLLLTFLLLLFCFIFLVLLSF